jgi:hypothetical protein
VAQAVWVVTLTEVSAGVYDVRHFSGMLRVVVIHELHQQKHNALLHLFSAQAELLRYGIEHYQQRSKETSNLLRILTERYQEDPSMADLLQKFTEETIDEFLKKLPPKERMKGLSPKERLEGLSLAEVLAALSPEEREALIRRARAESANPPPNEGAAGK